MTDFYTGDGWRNKLKIRPIINKAKMAADNKHKMIIIKCMNIVVPSTEKKRAKNERRQKTG